MASSTEEEVPNLPAEDGFGAEWDHIGGVIWLVGWEGGRFLVSPEEVRRLYAWVQQHKLS